MYELLETKNFKGMVEMFYRNGLEIALDAEEPAGLVKCWEVIDTESGKRVGGVVLEKRAGEFVIGDVAVESDHRGKGLGTQMIRAAIDEVRSLNGSRVMLTSKVPEYFARLGFSAIESKDAPNISKCMTCGQYNVDCFPKVMYIDLQ